MGEYIVQSGSFALFDIWYIISFFFSTGNLWLLCKKLIVSGTLYPFKSPSFPIFLVTLYISGISIIGAAKFVNDLSTSDIMKIITLTTDFGISDWYVACLKAVILSINPQATIIDVTHLVPSQDILAGSLILRNSDYFPEGTIHVAVVDPGVGSSRRGIIVELSNSQIYVCPDNGLLSFLMQKHRIIRAHVIENQNFCRQTISSTFHGRDIFAPVAAHISLGTPLSQFGQEISLESLKTLELASPQSSPSSIQGRIIYIDKFGNLISNITRAHLPGRILRAVVNSIEISKVLNTYSEAAAGEAGVLFGSEGFLEVSVNQGSAQQHFSAGLYTSLELFIS